MVTSIMFGWQMNGARLAYYGLFSLTKYYSFYQPSTILFQKGAMVHSSNKYTYTRRKRAHLFLQSRARTLYRRFRRPSQPLRMKMPFNRYLNKSKKDPDTRMI